MKAVPKLRFKSFTDKWSILSLEAVTEKIQDGTHFSPVQQEQGNYKYVTSKNIRNGFMDLSEISFLSDEAHKEIYKRCDVKYNDVLLTKDGASTGAVCLNELKEEFSLLSSVAFLRANKNIALNEFIYQVLAGPKGQSKIKASIAGQAITRITLSKIRNYQFHFPSLAEQQKIASFLRAVDEKIQQLTRKRELLEQYKKGLMQQLFSGKLRFKDENGKTYPKWEEKLFENIYSFYSTNSLSRDKLNYKSGSVKNIHYGDIHTKFRSQFIINEEYVPYINRDVDLSKVKDENYCREGDLVIADASEDYNDIGKSIELVKLKNEKVVAGLHTFLARPDLSKIKIGFSGYLVQAPYVRMQVKKIAQGTKVLSLSPSRLGKVKLLVPGKEEQQKIASFLTALDAKIERVASQIAHTQTFKKGLLQQMFV